MESISSYLLFMDLRVFVEPVSRYKLTPKTGKLIIRIIQGIFTIEVVCLPEMARTIITATILNKIRIKT